jgi:PKD repeat protein
VYTKSGSYSASVTVKDTAGLSSPLKSVTVKVLADVAPTAVLNLSSTRVSRGGSVVANGSASSDPDTTPVATYRFDCGNGHTTTNQASPTTTCTYTTTGNFTVRMWVTDTAGNVSSTTKKVQVK